MMSSAYWVNLDEENHEALVEHVNVEHVSKEMDRMEIKNPSQKVKKMPCHFLRNDKNQRKNTAEDIKNKIEAASKRREVRL